MSVVKPNTQSHFLSGTGQKSQRIAAEAIGLQAQLEDACARRTGVERLFSESAVTKQRFEELHLPLEQEIRGIEARLKALRAKLNDTEGTPLQRPTLSAWQAQWAAWPPKRKRQIISTFVGRITIHGDEIEITYLFPDSSSKEPLQVQQITPPTNQTPSMSHAGGPVYIRLPKPGERCAITGLSRAKLNELILRNKRNNFNPPVASKSLRQKGAQRGIRLVLLESLMAYLSGKNLK